MRATVLIALAVGVVSASAAARGPATQPTTAATKPAARPPRVPDVLKGAVDPYEPAGERGRFFQAAGPDNELDTKELAAARGKANSFVRRFDRWEAMLPFDKDKNKTLDWFEADAYRQDVRKRVLQAFDANKDGRLTGSERAKANAMLAAGRVPGGRSGGRLRDSARQKTAAGGDRAWLRQRMEQRRRTLYQAHDADRDGQIDEAERRAMLEAIRKEAQGQLAEQQLRRWDADGDGQLGDEERAAMDAQLAEARTRGEAWRQQRELARWDADDDGEFSEEERAAMEAEQARQRTQGEAWRREWERRQFDLDDDGRLDERERLLAEAERARREAYQRGEEMGGPGRGERDERMRAVVREWRVRHFDEDGDGELGEGEQAALRRFEGQMRGMGQRLRTRFADMDGDGKVTEAEQAASRDEWRRASWRMFARGFRYMDTNADGQVSPRERDDFRRRMQAGFVGYVGRLTERYDADRDGRLAPREREALVRGIEEQFERRIEKFDANRDGRLDPKEALDMMARFADEELGIRPPQPREEEEGRRRE